MKTFNRILYFILVAVITFFVVTSSETSKLESFLTERRPIVNNSNTELIQTVTLTYTNKLKKAYVYNDPIFSETYLYKENNKIIYSFDLYFYKFFEQEGKKINSSLAMIIKNIQINDENLLLTDKEQIYLDAEINFDKKFHFNGHNYSKSMERFQNYEGTDIYLLLFNYEYLKNESLVYANISDITITYKVLGDISKTLLTLINDDLSEIEVSDKFGDVNRDISSTHSKNIVNNNITLDNLIDNPIYFHNKELLGSLKKYNSFYYKYILIEMLFIVPLTYLLFFNKDVIRLIKDKKQKKIQNIENIKKQKNKEEK